MQQLSAESPRRLNKRIRARRQSGWFAQKLKIVGETDELIARASDAAARHGVCESLVFSWRCQVREGRLVVPEMAVFVPVQMHELAFPAAKGLPHPDERSLSASSRPSSRSDLIEIELGDGRQVRVGNDVNLAALRRVLIALRG